MHRKTKRKKADLAGGLKVAGEGSREPKSVADAGKETPAAAVVGLFGHDVGLRIVL